MTAPATRRSDRTCRPLPPERLTSVEGWGMLDKTAGYVYRPATIEGVLKVLQEAQRSGHTVVPRGSGYSYGDTSLNRENIVLDLTRMNRVLSWDPGMGIIQLEPGVTVRQLWEYVLEDGWWPPVVPGAMYPTVGGCAAVNVHGKNNWYAGPLSEHIVALGMLLPSGDLVACGPEMREDLFRAAVGGLGMLGVIVSITLRMKSVTSGLLRVQQVAVDSLDEMFDAFQARLSDATYLVGWIDGFAAGPRLGRGLVQIARDVHDDPSPQRTLRADYQRLPDTVAGLVPRSRLWLGMRPMINDAGMRLLNRAQYSAGSLRAGRISTVPHAQFHFFHDFVPDWKRSFTPGGILQYQVFVPRAHARSVFRALLETSQRHRLYPYLAVFKAHRADESLLRYNVDGYSLALDYHAHAGNTNRLRHMLGRLTREVVLPAGGRFYPAKDNLCAPGSAAQIFGRPAVDEFLACKDRLDPEGVFQSDLFRRLFHSDPSDTGRERA